jgi:multisubunit Na+/H+ antiporter MnhF subunit
VNGWLTAAAVVLAGGLGPALVRISHGPPQRRMVAQNCATVLAALVFLLAAQGFGRPSYVDLALVLAVLGPAGTLIYARFVTRLPRSRLYTALVWGGVPLTVLPLCVATPPGRATVKLLVVGVLLVAGGVATTRSVHE